MWQLLILAGAFVFIGFIMWVTRRLARSEKIFYCQKHTDMGEKKPISIVEFERDVYGWCDECTKRA